MDLLLSPALHRPPFLPQHSAAFVPERDTILGVTLHKPSRTTLPPTLLKAQEGETQCQRAGSLPTSLSRSTRHRLQQNEPLFLGLQAFSCPPKSWDTNKGKARQLRVETRPDPLGTTPCPQQPPQPDGWTVTLGLENPIFNRLASRLPQAKNTSATWSAKELKRICQNSAGFFSLFCRFLACLSWFPLTWLPPHSIFTFLP